jgi:mono/diheme cytochrome c family protein
MRKLARLMVWLIALSGGVWQAAADEQALVLSRAGVTHRFTVSELLARADAADVVIEGDVAYGRSTSYRAVPLLALLSELPPDSRSDTLESRAADGFVAQIPLSLVTRAATGGAVPWIAVEPPNQPWPALPGKAQGAGPFYLVWQNPERSGVAKEQWPYQLASLAVVESPAHRWPQLATDPALPPDAPARKGEMVFAANCLPCHRLNGGGAGEMGPDLGAPMNVTEYLTEKGLRAIVRNPRAVRTWPLEQMPGFTPEAVSDSDLDALVAYLQQAAHRASGPAARAP